MHGGSAEGGREHQHGAEGDRRRERGTSQQEMAVRQFAAGQRRKVRRCPRREVHPHDGRSHQHGAHDLAHLGRASRWQTVMVGEP